jgi:hypothetical protein
MLCLSLPISSELLTIGNKLVEREESRQERPVQIRYHSLLAAVVHQKIAMNRTSLFFMLDSLSSCSSPRSEGCLLYVLELYPGSAPPPFSSLTTHTHALHPNLTHPSIPTTTVATVVSASVFISQHNTQIHFTRIRPSIYPNNSCCNCGQRSFFISQHNTQIHFTWIHPSIHLSEQLLLQMVPLLKSFRYDE